MLPIQDHLLAQRLAAGRLAHMLARDAAQRRRDFTASFELTPDGLARVAETFQHDRDELTAVLLHTLGRAGITPDRWSIRASGTALASAAVALGVQPGELLVALYTFADASAWQGRA